MISNQGLPGKRFYFSQCTLAIPAHISNSNLIQTVINMYKFFKYLHQQTGISSDNEADEKGNEVL
jgi:hypothetical protein